MKRRHARKRRPARPRLIAILREVAEPELPDGLYEGADGRLLFTCVSCGRRDCEWHGTADEFDPGNPDHRRGWCGPHCCP